MPDTNEYLESTNTVTRLLAEIAENTAGGGGGGGSSLPAVTSDDNGDVLTVVEGQWAKAAPSGGGAYAVTVTNDGTTISANKTWQEIYDHWDNILFTFAREGYKMTFLPSYISGEEGHEVGIIMTMSDGEGGTTLQFFVLQANSANDYPGMSL